MKPEYKELFANLDYDKMTHRLENYMALEAGLGAKRGRAGRDAAYKAYTRVRWGFHNGTQSLGWAYREKKRDNGKRYKEWLKGEQREKFVNVDYYISQRTHNVKCYSFNIPFIQDEKIHRFRLEIHPDLLHKTCLYDMVYVKNTMEGGEGPELSLGQLLRKLKESQR